MLCLLYLTKLKGLLTVWSHQLHRSRNIKWRANQTPQLPSQLCPLPVELIEYILAELDLADLCSLRLTCKEISLKTLHHFGSTHPATLRTNLSQTSLEQLEQLSRHKQLMYYVQTLLLKGERVDDNELGRGFARNRRPSGSLIFPIPVSRLCMPWYLDWRIAGLSGSVTTMIKTKPFTRMICWLLQMP